MSTALKSFSTKNRPQMEQDEERQVKNNAGGYVYQVSDKSRLERFLILGVDGGTYYVSERDLTKQNYDFLVQMVQTDTRFVVDTIVEISDSGRAPKNSPAIFALAVALVHAPDNRKAEVRAAVTKVCRTSTHLFEFAQYLENLGGWGRSKKSAIADWYTTKTPEQLAYQAVKYRQRNGWTHRDLLRLSHPKGLDANVTSFILGKDVETTFPIIEGFRIAQSSDVKGAAVAIAKYRLPWEAIPTQFLNDPLIWNTLIDNNLVGQTALIRNVSRLEKIGMFKDLRFAADVADMLSSEERIKSGRIHPVAVLNALYAYKGGDESDYYNYSAKPTNPVILDALESAFYTSFGNVKPSNARTMLSLDVSGSMTWGTCGGLLLTPRVASAAMALVTLRTEKYTAVNAFTTSLTPLNISKSMSIGEVLYAVSRLPFGGTDCSLPMQQALKTKQEIDHFIIYTDNETWAGKVKPAQALRNYRNKMGINAKLTVVGMAGTPFTIADPLDTGMLDVVGFDASAPAVIADFARV